MAKKEKARDPVVPEGASETGRTRLRSLLEASDWGVEELMAEMSLSRRQLEQELEHLSRSARRRGGTLAVGPARCRACGAEVHPRAARPFHAPARCPNCRCERMESPRFRFLARP